MAENCCLYDEFFDVPYSSDERQKFDLFLPKNDNKTISLMIFVHGGGWKSGQKEDYRKNMVELMHKFSFLACASIGYRFISEEMKISFEDIQNDISNAVHTIRKYIENLGFKIYKTAMGGISAGAYNCMMYAFRKNSIKPETISFILDKSGPCDLSDKSYYNGTAELDKDMAYRIYGQLLCLKYHDENFYDVQVQLKLKNASPYYLVNEHSPPLIVAHSQSDLVVPFSSSQKFLEKLRFFNIKCDFVDMGSCGHSQTDEAIETKINDKLSEYIDMFLDTSK